jgi:hypothetical protein
MAAGGCASARRRARTASAASRACTGGRRKSAARITSAPWVTSTLAGMLMIAGPSSAITCTGECGGGSPRATSNRQPSSRIARLLQVALALFVLGGARPVPLGSARCEPRPGPAGPFGGQHQSESVMGAHIAGLGGRVSHAIAPSRSGGSSRLARCSWLPDSARSVGGGWRTRAAAAR